MTLASGTRVGPYEVLGMVGAGGMGEVYKAKDTLQAENTFANWRSSLSRIDYRRPPG